MHILIVLFMIANVIGVGFAAETGMPAREWHAVSINGHPGVVAPRDAAPEFALGDAEGYWLPSERWLTDAEDAIAIEAGQIVDEDRRPVLDGYRQYAGFIEDGDRKIAINSSCVELTSWRSTYVLVMDGGHCFWGATYNVDTGEVEHLVVNGEA